MQAQAGEERQYGLDWLRIGAFGLLILYHIGMFFVPWEWHVKTALPLAWLELPMLAINPWRLLLLFVISGFASRVLLARMKTPSAFARSRSRRLLIPLVAGMALFVAPQAWAELRYQGVYDGGFLTFWINDYFGFKQIAGVDLPTWNHLWFVVYLWAYTVGLALLACLPGSAKERMQRGFDRLFAGRRLLVVPVAYLAATRVLLFPIYGETYALVGDVYAHAIYGFAFIFGVGLAGSPGMWHDIATIWKAALGAALVSFSLLAAMHIALVEVPGEIALLAAGVCRSLQAWGAVLALLGIARLYLHREGPMRRYLTEAIFPYYIVHQTIIVLVGFSLAPLGLGAGAEFALIFGATVTGCALSYEVGRRVGWLRPILGLKPAKGNRASCDTRTPLPQR